MFNFFKKKLNNTTLFFDTDVHCHILPGVDHGAQSIEDSLEMLQGLIDMGIKRVICTSHVTSETFENTPETLSHAYNLLCDAVSKVGLEVELHFSAEYRIDEYWDKQYAAGNICPMPGKYLLMENSFQQELLLLDDLMFDLMVKGYKPILAHPERYIYYSHRRDRLTKLHNSGVKFQVNILSLAGYFGSTARDMAYWLIKNNYVDFLGTDLHNMDQIHVIKEFIKSKDWRKITRALEPYILNDMIK